MGAMTETLVLSQLKSAQAETNTRLEALVREQARTNQLLEWVGSLLAQLPAGRGA